MEKQVRASKPRIDLTGKQFGYLTPVEYIKGGKWLCHCKCGNENISTKAVSSAFKQTNFMKLVCFLHHCNGRYQIFNENLLPNL